MIMLNPEIAILERIQSAQDSSEHLTQRDLAQASGLSLGMTNSLVRRLVERGLLSLTRLSSRTVRYALTPEGAAEITRRTKSFLRRAANGVQVYGELVEAFVMASKREGARTLVLVGPSEADFVLEYACDRHDLVYIKTGDAEKARAMAERPGVVLVWGERAALPAPAASSVRRHAELVLAGKTIKGSGSECSE